MVFCRDHSAHITNCLLFCRNCQGFHFCCENQFYLSYTPQ